MSYLKRALFVLGLASIAVLVMAARPPGEFPMLLRLNGRPAFIGFTAPGADGGTKGTVDAGSGAVVKTQCYAAACVCPGLSCTCAINQATTGEKVAADGVQYMVLEDSDTAVTTAAYPGSLLPDGGAGAHCDHWLMR